MWCCPLSVCESMNQTFYLLDLWSSVFVRSQEYTLLIFPSLALTNHMTQSFFSPSANHLHCVIQLIVLPHWPKIGPSSSFLHCILVLWREIVSSTRLEWISCSASGRGGPLTDLGMLRPSSLTKQSDRCTQLGGLRRTILPSCHLLTELLCSEKDALVWRFLFNGDLHATYSQKECEMVYNKTSLKQDRLNTFCK